ncbi:hypothetical protein [Desulfovibrio sp. Huiquan2017]|uniref:hypothetical protein n=1 Tax=Desulfovibrio sp. Huiquan2017 TaxID=2816861 RepID=UPI001A911097|nr:hypothetical protein [Desulfovibrio sp. Huiquan2017]
MQIDGLSNTHASFTLAKPATEKGNAPTSGVDLTGFTSKNMLASNFFDNDYKESKYTAGLLDSLKIKNSFDTQLQGIVQQAKQAMKAVPADNYAERLLAVDKVVKGLETVVEDRVSDEVGDEIEKNTDEMEKTVEEKATENQGEAAQALADAADAVPDETPSGDEEGDGGSEKTAEAAPPIVENPAPLEAQPQTPAAALAEETAAGTSGDPVATQDAMVQRRPRLDLIV